MVCKRTFLKVGLEFELRNRQFSCITQQMPGYCETSPHISAVTHAARAHSKSRLARVTGKGKLRHRQLVTLCIESTNYFWSYNHYIFVNEFILHCILCYPTNIFIPQLFKVAKIHFCHYLLCKRIYSFSLAQTVCFCIELTFKTFCYYVYAYD